MSETIDTTEDQAQSDEPNIDFAQLAAMGTKKHKILFLSDHPLAASGVGVQARFLINGLIDTGRFTFRCLGGAMKHVSYDVIQVNPDFIIKPVNGFGTKELVRQLLVAEKPDAVFLFTDPRQFIWIWEMEDEIRSICPIVYWHVWDNDPYPKFNGPWYEGTDLINCISKKTFDLVKPNFPDKTHYVPHAFPENTVVPLPKEQANELRKQNFGPKADWFTGLWVNRNATRKMPGDLLAGFAKFVDNLEKKYGHRNASLIMHTDPNDIEGPNLIAIAEEFGILGNVMFSKEKLNFEQMNTLYNVVDYGVNISKNEGFGLLCLNLLQTGKPVIALKTGGMTEQVLDPETGFEFGVAIEPAKRALVGSQSVPFIYEDYCTHEQVADAMMKLYEMSPDQRELVGQKAIEHVRKNFNYQNVVNKWAETLEETIAAHSSKLTSRWTVTRLSIKPQDAKKENAISAPVPAKETQPLSASVMSQPVKINNDKESLRSQITISPVSV